MDEQPHSVSGYTRAGTAFLMGSRFVVAYSLPYMLNKPGNLGPKVGFIFGPIAFLSLLWGVCESMQ
jgi:hypothetical protein